MSMDRPPEKKKVVNPFSLLQMETKKLNNKPTNKMQRNNTSSSSSHNNKNEISKDKKQAKEIKSIIEDPDVPDRSYGDYYCKICDSHMNSDGMWDAHIIGRRHLKNVKKGDIDTRYEEIDEESQIKHEIRNVKDPVVGLSYIHEIRRREPGVPPYYNCFLCHASISTVPLVIEHVISLKHRQNYIKENNSDQFDLLCATKLKKAQLEPLIHETVLKLEEQHGRGTVKVKQEKPKKIGPYKRHYASSSEEDDYRKPPKNKKRDSPSSVGYWESVESMKNNNKFRGSGSQKEIEDEYKRKDEYRRSHSPGSNNPYRRDSGYSRQPEYDNYSSKKSSSKYSRSTGHESKPRTQKQATEDYSRTLPDQYGPSCSYTPQSVSLPREIKEDKTPSNPSALKNVVENIFALPAEIVLKIVIYRLRNMDRELQAVDELHLLSQVMTECQNILNKKLAPLRRTETCSPRSNIPYGPGLAPPVTDESNHKLPSAPEQQSDKLGFIRDILNSVKNANAASSSNQNTPGEQNSHQNVSMGSYQNPHTNSHQNTGVSSYQNSNYQNYYSSSQSNLSSSIPGPTSTNFSSPIPEPTSTIPGLSLSENEATEPQQYYTYQTHYSSSRPDARQNYPYGY